MIIKKFTSESHFLPAYIVLWGLILWIDAFINFRSVDFFVNPHSAPLYKLISLAFKNAQFFNVLFAFILMIVQAFMLNNLFTSKSLIERNSYLPALFYITFMSFDSNMLSLNPLIFANFFLIIALNKVFDVYNEEEVFLEVFNSGLLIGIATMIYFPAGIFYVFLITALVVYYLINLRGFLSSLLGFLTPALYIAVYYFMTGQLAEKSGVYFSDIYFLSVFSYNFENYQLIFLAFITFIGFIALFRVYVNYSRNKPVRIRKRYTALAYFMIFSALSYLFINVFFVEHFTIMAISLSPIYAVFFDEMKKRFWKETLFAIIITLILLGKLSSLGYVNFL